ncbi:MAG: DUF302 domain-containing protein [Campylobacteraceae bacterium]|jgi:uncharacterized protein (DUF302 family)|nr:DUF302 domain-containing protein [Campylobacteraceae bacterium]MBT3882225.1 DUF302 domain-containing protein [Campylobacteraceae bacterium]MBT4030621.1 DUF302 domain-containing protein [Campylobacteraceae bacterium]MBT4179256.1 DUF302 domain-containing protein [Campylobacteraceae bacterium]MBT4571936.1 DUF302 domain-containing protein [Campylobacteraceae bacterium]
MKFLTGLISGIILIVAIGYTNMDKGSSMMFSEVQSKLSYEDTVKAVVDSYKKNGWSVLTVKDTNKSFMSKGKPSIGNITNIKVCNGKVAYRILKDDAHKHIITMMPCGVGVYEKNGKVYVATMNISLMKNFFSGEERKVMDIVASDTQKILAFLKQ